MPRPKRLASIRAALGKDRAATRVNTLSRGAGVGKVASAAAATANLRFDKQLPGLCTIKSSETSEESSEKEHCMNDDDDHSMTSKKYFQSFLADPASVSSPSPPELAAVGSRKHAATLEPSAPASVSGPYTQVVSTMQQTPAVQYIVPKSPPQQMVTKSFDRIARTRCDDHATTYSRAASSATPGKISLRSSARPLVEDDETASELSSAAKEVAAFASSLRTLGNLLELAVDRLEEKELVGLSNEINHDWQVSEMGIFVRGYLLGGGVRADIE